MPGGLLLGREVFDAVEAAAQEPGALRKGTCLPQDRGGKQSCTKGQEAGMVCFQRFQ